MFVFQSAALSIPSAATGQNNAQNLGPAEDKTPAPRQIEKKIGLEVARATWFLSKLASDKNASRYLKGKKELRIYTSSACVCTFEYDETKRGYRGFYVSTKQPNKVREIIGFDDDTIQDHTHIMLAPNDPKKDGPMYNYILLGGDMRVCSATRFRPREKSVPIEVRKDGALFGDSQIWFVRSFGKAFRRER